MSTESRYTQFVQSVSSFFKRSPSGGSRPSSGEYQSLLSGMDEDEEEEEGSGSGEGGSVGEPPRRVMESISSESLGVGPGQIAAERAMTRYLRIAKNKTYDRYMDALGTALQGMNAVLDSRLGKSVVKPMQVAADKIFRQLIVVNQLGQAVDRLLKAEGTSDSTLETQGRELENALVRLDELMVGVAVAIRDAQQGIKDHVDTEIRKNLDKNYENLHADTVMVFAGLDKANTYLSLAIGVTASAVGHPEVGAAVKTTIGAILKVAREGTKLVQKELDFRDDTTHDEAESLLGHDREDVLNVKNIMLVADIAGKITTKALDLAGVDTSLLSEIKKVTSVDGVLDTTFELITTQAKEAVKSGPVGDTMIDELANRVKETIGEQIKEALEEAKKKGEEKADELLKRLESNLRGERRETPMDLNAELEKLDSVLDDLENPSVLSRALGRMLNQTRKETYDVDALRSGALSREKSGDYDTAVEWLCGELSTDEWTLRPGDYAEYTIPLN